MRIRRFSVRRSNQISYVTGVSVHSVAVRQFGADVTVRWEGIGIYAVWRDYGHGVTAVVGRISPVRITR